MNEQRRLLLAGAAALLPTAGAQAASQGGSAATPRRIPPGNPGEFDFLNGEWRITHRRLTAPDTWDTFEGEATCFGILGGVASVEELRIPARNFSGMGLRILDVEARVWSDFWVNAKSGVLTTPGTTGGFIDGAGLFMSDDMDGDTPIIVRGLWDRITPISCRWSQAVSRDGGASWQDNWLMEWTRAPAG
ncbi:hypothetical protein U91I_00926 [alpha proteobacterium U9-1i]|nr:hypothetical protein U91I_00926 [alpha proteobacterium U9-1i]